MVIGARVKTQLRNWFRSKKIRCPLGLVEDTVARHGAQAWFAYSFRDRRSRWEQWRTSNWLANNLPATSTILDSGCGIGSNLLWLGQNGFSQLLGFDLDERAIDCGKEIAKRLEIELNLWCADGLNPTGVVCNSVDAVLVMNWLMLVPKVDLSQFLTSYASLLRTNGVLFLDVIDKSYDTIPNNEYLTSDWQKPAEDRQSTEYKSRFSRSDVEAAVITSGFLVEHVWLERQIVPRRVYRLRRT